MDRDDMLANAELAGRQCYESAIGVCAGDDDLPGLEPMLGDYEWLAHVVGKQGLEREDWGKALRAFEAGWKAAHDEAVDRVG